MQYVYSFLNLIPKGKVISYKTLSNIFLLHPRKIAKILSENKLQDKYPCYKVVNSNGNLGGYNLGIDEKIKRLQQDGIKIIDGKIGKEYFWKPKLFNFFVAFPLEGNEIDKFKNLYNKIKEIYNGSFTLQKKETPHITLRFFGQLNIKDFKNIVYLTLKNISKIRTNLKNQIVNLNKVGDFNKRVYFYEPRSENIRNEFKKIYIQYHKLINYPKEQRAYHPHLTILRVKNDIKFFEIENKIKNILNKYSFQIKINKLTFYAAIDSKFQIPLIDVKL